METVWRFGFCC